MINLKFEDYIIEKYSFIGRFHEGLATVKHANSGLYGFINKKGIEVIPCQFRNVITFSEGLCAVQNNDSLWGYIDKKGNEVITCQFEEAKCFSEGLCAVKNNDSLWGYIDKSGNYVIEPNYVQAYSFHDGYGEIEETGYNCVSYINREGQLHGEYQMTTTFESGLAVVKDFDDSVYIVDTDFKKRCKIDFQAFKIEDLKNGLGVYENSLGKYGYYGIDGKIKIPAIYDGARDFSNGVAICEFKNDLIGIVYDNGTFRPFDKKSQYRDIRDFSEERAAVQSPNSLWGYIDKRGNKVIECKYGEVDSFSEGLAGVYDSNASSLYYIDKNGKKKIQNPKLYMSILYLEDKTVYIEAENEEELLTKKTAVLEEVKKHAILEVDAMTSDILIDYYEQSILSKKKPQS